MRYLIVLLFALISSAAVAETSRAVVIDEGWCANLGLEDGEYVIVYNYTDKKRVVASHGAKGNVTLICEARDVPNDTGKAWTFKGYDMGLYCGYKSVHGQLVTDDVTYTLTPSGIARTSCHFDMSSLQ